MKSHPRIRLFSMPGRDNVSLVPQPWSYTVFSGGEPHVDIASIPNVTRPMLIDARLKTPEDFLVLLCLTDALHYRGASLHLFCPYFPGARQDRQTVGFAFTARVYAQLINAQGYQRVAILDPHSDVTPALIDRVHVLGTDDLIEQVIQLTRAQTIICPDAGAEKRAMRASKLMREPLPIIFAHKHRDQKTGQILSYDLKGMTPDRDHRYLVIDDICDGGRTFTMLADAARLWSGSAVLNLWTTHGIYSQGMAPLQRYQSVWSSDSFPTEVAPGGTFTTLSLDSTRLAFANTL